MSSYPCQPCSPIRRALFAAALALLFATSAMAHTVFLSLSVEDGKLRIESGFSDGGTGAGLPVEIRDATSDAVLQEHRMPESGVLTVERPTVPYTVTLDAGEGHRISKPGPADAGDAPRQAQILDVQWGDGRKLSGEAKQAIAAAKVVVAHDWLYQRMKEVFTDQTLVLIEPGVTLSADTPDSAKLRDKIRTRLRTAFDSGDSVLILSPVAAKDSPDWQWMLEEEMAIPYAAPSAETPAPSAPSAVPEL